MVPNSKWFPSSLQERAAWFGNFATQFDAVAVSLGFVAADVTAVNTDNSVMQALANIAPEADAYAAAVRQYRVILTEGDIGDPTPAFPDPPAYAAPGAVPTGLFERLDNLVKRIRVSPAYTTEIGALLGILIGGVTPIAPDDMQPSIKTTTLPGSVVQVKFVRGNTDGVVIETKVDYAPNWSEAGRFFKSPAELVIPGNESSLPRSVQVRARYVEGDKPVGLFSDVATVSTLPEG